MHSVAPSLRAAHFTLGAMSAGRKEESEGESERFFDECQDSLQKTLRERDPR